MCSRSTFHITSSFQACSWAQCHHDAVPLSVHVQGSVTEVVAGQAVAISLVTSIGYLAITCAAPAECMQRCMQLLVDCMSPCCDGRCMVQALDTCLALITSGLRTLIWWRRCMSDVQSAVIDNADSLLLKSGLAILQDLPKHVPQDRHAGPLALPLTS